MKVIFTLLLSLTLSLAYAQEDLLSLSSRVDNMTIKTVSSKENTLKPVKSYEKRYPEVIVRIAKDYFATIDLDRSDWNNLSASKSLFFRESGEIVQEITIEVPPIYEMLLFSNNGSTYKANKLLEKTIKKQCDRYVRHAPDFKDNLDEYLKIANMTNNKVVAKLKSSKVVVVNFNCLISK